jgi:hypothetical protein
MTMSLFVIPHVGVYDMKSGMAPHDFFHFALECS